MAKQRPDGGHPPLDKEDLEVMSINTLLKELDKRCDGLLVTAIITADGNNDRVVAHGKSNGPHDTTLMLTTLNRHMKLNKVPTGGSEYGDDDDE